MTNKKPQLAIDSSKVDLDKHFSKGGYLIASPKLDGIRCSVQGGVVLSRTLKPIPCDKVQELFGDDLMNGFDGELIAGSSVAPDVCRNTVHNCMCDNYPEDGSKLTFYVFDLIDEDGLTYQERLDKLYNTPRGSVNVVFLGSVVVRDMADVERFESECLGAGYEGVVLKSPVAMYKHGRSTKTKMESIKVKRYEDSEAEILEVLPKMHNGNEAKVNELGRTSRSSSKKGLTAVDEIGTMRVKDIHTGQEFSIGVFRGLPKSEKERLWLTKDDLIGKIVKYKYFDIGVKDLPRHPTYLGFRD